MSKKEFSELGLSDRTLSAIINKGFEEPTAVQAATIPLMLERTTDIIAKAQTGTGKTAAFGLPLLDLVDDSDKSIQALILTPTRELAIQVAEEINSLSGSKNISIVPIYGGQSIDQQLRMLKRGVQIVVGTPGRVIDHINRRTLKLQNTQHLILDEADEMLSMGFVEDIEEIMKHTPKEKNTLLFSATMPKRIENLAKKYMKDYKLLDMGGVEQQTTKLTEQIYFEVKNSDKFEALCRIIDFKEDFYGLVFCRTKRDVDDVSSRLTNRGYDAEAIHSDISQGQRERVLTKFRKKQSNIMIATDVAARGIDVNDLTHVINYAIPKEAESYVHRIGRTGRAGKQGTAVTFITPNEYRSLLMIQKKTKTNIKKSSIPKVEDIIKARRKKITNDLNELATGELDPKYYSWAKKLLSYNQPTELLATILTYCFKDQLNDQFYTEINENLGKNKGKQIDDEGKVRLFVALGKKDGYSIRNLVDKITDKAPIRSSEIKDIQIMDKFSFITVPFSKAEDVISMFKNKGNDRKALITIAKNPKK